MEPSLMNRVRSCGILAVRALLAVWLGNAPLVGVMLTGGIEGGPLKVRNVPWALSVVPCGIEAIRTRVVPSAGSVVGGTIIHTPGSKWMPIGFAGLVISLTVSRYETPLRKMSGVTSPRFGTDPIGREKDSVWLVRFSSRRLSDGPGETGSLVGEPRSGRKMVLNPWPWNVPVNADSGPKLGTAAGVLPSVLGTSPN